MGTGSGSQSLVTWRILAAVLRPEPMALSPPDHVGLLHHALRVPAKCRRMLGQCCACCGSQAWVAGRERKSSLAITSGHVGREALVSTGMAPNSGRHGTWLQSSSHVPACQLQARAVIRFPPSRYFTTCTVPPMCAAAVLAARSCALRRVSTLVAPHAHVTECAQDM